MMSACAVTEAVSLVNNMKQLDAECLVAMKAPAIDPIREKVQLWPRADASPPLTMASNDTLASESERNAIVVWLDIRAECIRQQADASLIPPDANPRMAEMLHDLFWGAEQVQMRVTSAIGALRDREITYGDLARRSYELRRSANVLAKQLGPAYRRGPADAALVHVQFLQLLRDFDAYLASVGHKPAMREVQS
jgi:hypothetical protein